MPKKKAKKKKKEKKRRLRAIWFRSYIQRVVNYISLELKALYITFKTDTIIL